MPAAPRTVVRVDYANDNFNLFAYTMQGVVPGWPTDDDGFTGAAALTLEHAAGDGRWTARVAQQVLTELQADRTPTTTERDRVDLLAIEVGYSREGCGAFGCLSVGARAGLVASGEFGGAFVQNLIHERAGGRLLMPRPGAGNGHDEQLQDRYPAMRRATPTVGADLGWSYGVFGERLVASLAATAQLNDPSAAPTMVGVSAAARFEPLGPAAPVSPHLSVGIDQARYFTDNGFLSRPGWYDTAAWQAAPTLSVGVRLFGVDAEVRVSQSPARQDEPIVTSRLSASF